jgi:hypothetical protein
MLDSVRELLQNVLGEELIDFPMSWNGLGHAVFGLRYQS